ncbi:tetratricopeptide repeat protein [Synechococcus sp. A15-28]|uniref:tetratricopeptide repeat protein n=1 Tax=Synechococcus sp. A15-28 TaxID=1050638 RepID=UPI001645B8AA|nr:tetratricopeptide repeat protein [Synechococcus sp. A15-28]
MNRPISISLMLGLLLQACGASSFVHLRIAEESLYKKGKESIVIEESTKALDIEESAEAYYMRGVAHNDLDNFAKAQEDLSSAIRMNSKVAKYHYVLGNNYDDQNEFKSAINSYSQAIEIQPKHINAIGNRALAKRSIGDLNGAIQDFSMAINIDPMHANNLRMRGNLKYQLNDFSSALDDYNKAASIDSKIADEKAWRSDIHADVLFDRGYALFRLERISEACSDWEESLALGNDDSSIPIKYYCQ